MTSNVFFEGGQSYSYLTFFVAELLVYVLCPASSWGIHLLFPYGIVSITYIYISDRNFLLHIFDWA